MSITAFNNIHTEKVQMKRGEIYLLDLKQNLGAIQSGIRPVVVIQNDLGNQFSPTTIICCITSIRKKKFLPTHLMVSQNSGGLRLPSIILCEQILTINKTDLTTYIGTITDNYILNRLNKCLQNSLGLTNF